MSADWVATIWVPGIPQAKGNHRASVRGGRAHLYDANRGLKAWEQTVRLTAAEAHLGAQWTEPVELELRFVLPRPRTVRRLLPTKRSGGDLDKLVRAVGDALAGVVYVDDSQIVRLLAQKRYADESESPGCEVMIRVEGVA